MISPGDSEWSGAAGWASRGFQPAQQRAIQFLDQIVAELVGLVHAALHCGHFRVGCAGRARLVLDMPQIEVGAMLARYLLQPIFGSSSVRRRLQPASRPVNFRSARPASHAMRPSFDPAARQFHLPKSFSAVLRARAALAAAGSIVEQPSTALRAAATLPACARVHRAPLRNRMMSRQEIRGQGVVSSVGFEPTTHALKGRCSTN